MGPGVSSPICAAVCPVILGYLDDSDVSRCIYIGHTNPYSRYDENSHFFFPRRVMSEILACLSLQDQRKQGSRLTKFDEVSLSLSLA